MSKHKRKRVSSDDPSEWDTCDECGVTGPDVRKDKCAPHRGRKFPSAANDGQAEYWLARRGYWHAWRALEAREKELDEAREKQHEAFLVHQGTCNKLVRAERKWAPS